MPYSLPNMPKARTCPRRRHRFANLPVCGGRALHPSHSIVLGVTFSTVCKLPWFE
jgi:hypothetical protein